MKIQIMTKNMACAGTINWHKSSRIGANNRCWLRNIKRIPKASECQNEAEQISPLGRNEPSSLSQKNGQRHQYAIEHHRNMEANAPKMGLELLNSKAAAQTWPRFAPQCRDGSRSRRVNGGRNRLIGRERGYHGVGFGGIVGNSK